MRQIKLKGKRIQGRPDDRCAGADAVPSIPRTILCKGGGGTVRRSTPAQSAATARIASPLPTTLFTAAVVVLLFDEKIRI